MSKPRDTIWSRVKRAYQTFRGDVATEKRAYKAAAVNRLTTDWPFIPISINRELRTSLRILRNRIRVLAQNNDYIKKFLSMVAANVPGPRGMTLRIDFAPREEELTQREQVLAEEIRTSFVEWSCPEYASASGKLSFVDQQRLFIRTLARDGEVLVRKVVAGNRWGFALKFIDVAWLDELYNETLPNGNRIMMSVEVDQNDRPVAYWLTMPSSEYLWNAKPKGAPFRQRVLATEFIHAFLVLDDESQARGVPWAHTAMMRLRILDGYEEAELVAARVGACKMAWLLPPKDEDQQFDGQPEVDENGQPVQPDLIEQMEPGITSIAPAGYTVHDSAPTHPNTNYNEFIKGVLRGIAAGLEVSYNSLANDLEGVNYSSIRAGLLEERDVWRGLQQFMVDHFHHPVFKEWLRMAMLNGAVNISASDYARVREAWKPRGWPWVDPLKDVQATILAINNFLESRSDDADERGDDFFENVKRLRVEKKTLEEAELLLSSPPTDSKPTVPVNDEKDPDDDNDENEDKDKDEDDETRVLPVFARHLERPAALTPVS